MPSAVRIAGAVALLAALALLPVLLLGGRQVGPLVRQPVAFHHEVHAGELKIDCLYCHPYAETAAVAGLPTLQLCLTCHDYISGTHPQIKIDREHWREQSPVAWVRVSRLPDIAHFPHHSHLTSDAELECADCHDDLTKVKVLPERRFKMGWCLECHRRENASIDCLTCHY